MMAASRRLHAGLPAGAGHRWARLLLLAGLVALVGCGRKARQESTPGDAAAARHEQRVRDVAARRAARAARPQRSAAEMQGLQARLSQAAAMTPTPKTEGRALLRHLSPEQQALLDTAESRFRDAADDAARIELLDELEDVPHARVLAVAELAAASPDAEVRRRALEVLGGYEVADVIPLARRGLADAEADVRVAAVNALAAVADPGVTPVLKDALRDPDPAVREAVFAILDSKPADVRLDLYQAGILSTYEDVSEAVISAITFAPSHDALYVLFDGLNSPSADVRQSVNGALYFLISEQFSNRAEAVRWWEANRNRFDAELNEKQ